MKLSPVLFLFLLLGSCTAPEARHDWTVMTWNLQNLFDSVRQGREYRDFDPENGQWTDRLYNRRLMLLGHAISQAAHRGPDLLVLQELENSTVLQDLASGPLKDMNYTWRLSIPGYSNIRSGILSKYRLYDISVMDAGTAGERSLRPALAFTVESPGEHTRVIAVHWKSQRGGRQATEHVRIHEATLVRELAEHWYENHPDAPLIILGDFNTTGSGTHSPSALAEWEPGRSPSHAVLFHSMEQDAAGLQNGIRVYFNAASNHDFAPEATYWYRGQGEKLDHVLLGAAFLDGRGLEFRHIQTGLGGLISNSRGQPLSWDTETGEGYSDHLPLVLTCTVLPL